MAKLAEIATELAQMDARRTLRMQERDRLIRQARDEGISWKAIQSATGLSPRAIALSLERSARD